MQNRSLHILFRFLLAALLICASLILSSCGNKDSDTSNDDTGDISENTTPEENDINIDSFTVGYLTEDNYNEGNFEDEMIEDTAALDKGGSVYAIIDFSYTILKDIPEDASIIFGAVSEARGIIDITLQEAPTSAIKETKNNSGIYLTAEFSMPEEKDSQKSMRVVVRVLPLGSGTVSLTFDLTATDNIKLCGATSQKSNITRINSDITYTINDDALGYSVYSVSKTSSEIVIPDRLKDNLPVTGILNGAFNNRSRLERLTIGKNITSFENESELSDCTSLCEIKVDGENTAYTVIDESLYTKDGKTLIRYAPARPDNSFTINDSTTHIAELAFASATSLTEVYIPESVVSVGKAAFYKCDSIERITTSVIGSGNAEKNTHFGYIFGAESYESNREHLPQGLKTVILNGTTAIKSYAFAGCAQITSVKIPDTVTYIDYGAFKDCSALTEINIPASVNSLPFYLFSGCTSLESIVIPQSVTSIGNYAFERCESLSEIAISDEVSYIGTCAFSECTALTAIKLPDKLTVIPMYLFQNCSGLKSIELSDNATEVQPGAFSGCSSITTMVLPSGITAISDELFMNCTALESLVLPSDATSIGYAAFKGCTSLSKLAIPDAVITVGSRAFDGCTSLASIKIPDRVETLKEYTFSGCTSLTDAVLSRNLYTVEKYAFNECTSLTEIIIPYSVKEIYKYAFYGCKALNVCCEAAAKPDGWESYWSNSVAGVNFKHNLVLTNPSFTYVAYDGGAYIVDCKTISDVITVPSHLDGLEVLGIYSLSAGKQVILPSTLVSIARGAFKGCPTLTEIVIPDSVRYLGLGAFEGCTALTSVVLGDGITVISGYAFNGCSKLKSVEAGSGLRSIEMYAFANCSSLTELTLPKTLADIGYGSFYGCQSLSDVHFEGTESEINYTVDTWNESFVASTKHYTQSDNNTSTNQGDPDEKDI